MFSGSLTLALVTYELTNAETQNDAVPNLLNEVAAAAAGTSRSPIDAVASCLVAPPHSPRLRRQHSRFPLISVSARHSVSSAQRYRILNCQRRKTESTESRGATPDYVAAGGTSATRDV